MKYLVFLMFCCLQPVSEALAQTVSSPQVKCIAVDPVTGDVTLTWAIPTGPGGFVAYHIYSSTNQAGPYLQVGTVNTFAQNTFIHAGAGADLIRTYYLVQTEYNPGAVISNPIDTCSTIHLTVTNPGSGSAQLSWNKISLQNISTSSGWYRIYREYPTGVWTLIDSTQALNYSDEIDVCNTGGLTINYRVEIDDNTGCTSVSRIHGATLLSDITPPVLSSLDTVSVDRISDLATISWNVSTSPDADSVVIYQYQGGPWQKIATVPHTQTSYTYALSNAVNVSESYRVAFLDSCGNISAQGTPHNTIYLSSSFNICAGTASLLWNRYANWNPGVSAYKVYRSVNAGPYTLIGTNTLNDTDYVDTGISLGTAYCYLVQAENGTKTSSSNKVCFTPSVTQPPQFTYSRFASVDPDRTVTFRAHVDPAPSVSSYRLMRTTLPGSNYTSIAILPPPSGNNLVYNDNQVNTSANSYVYKLDVLDSCGQVIETSNTDTTMLLTAVIAPNLDVDLSWNDFGDWQGNVVDYEVYRSVDGVWDPAPIATVAFNGMGGSYTDDVSGLLYSRGVIAYYIKAQEGAGNSFGFADSSISNVATVYHFPKYLIPNTFTPNGDNLNDEFLPLIGFIEPTEYTFTVFDRSATPVFTTNDPLKGWDGKKKGKDCQIGVYMFLIQCKASNGEESKIYRTVTLLR